MAENKDNKSSIFRKKSLERVESPEKLNDNLRVTSPGVWLVLGAVIALLVGVVIWGILGTIESKSPALLIFLGKEEERLLSIVEKLEGNEENKDRLKEVLSWLLLQPHI